ncbi:MULTISPECIES: branched-chain amino acid ABC transporter permease [Brenneria]|uniref:Branched-chain amino acid ABC transporter permease n=1 Tax=Brenneria nigrifluens DSM 30175 = ATCC 13028 TaxID=1121120 RepID=A0A2U1UKB2_9GAMM|nr:MULTISPECIES: branched-chain amino acid ABC transporter permease [Brenneria]EHD20399.1 ABC-type transporter, integral membrane subunit [Brenneria sp. EniD312]PWC22077.1 branched-chain amino acid ABC transporter permease [Brenneria nigrifluens DSM 30175 = ATCC 13028]QCR03602.1 branched-chain amino acid ABC transporter permease [Brenneria nigrifluens DSM 30175 = ATCC 13028]
MMQLLFNGAVTGVLVALPALALSLTFSVLRFANFAIGAMVTAGAYLIYWCNTLFGLSLPLACLLGTVLAALLAVAIDLLVYRRLLGRSSITLLVASMGVALTLENLVRFFAGGTPVGYAVEVARPLLWGGLRINHEQLLTAGISFGCLALIGLIFHYTRLGRAMRAVADNPDLAATRGISHQRVVSMTWILSGALSAIAGMLIGLDSTLDPLMGWNYVLPVFAAAILGGLSNPLGAIAGALIMGMLSELSTIILPPHYRTLVAFLVLSLLLMLKPSGLLGVQWVKK